MGLDNINSGDVALRSLFMSFVVKYRRYNGKFRSITFVLWIVLNRLMDLSKPLTASNEEWWFCWTSFCSRVRHASLYEHQFSSRLTIHSETNLSKIISSFMSVRTSEVYCESWVCCCTVTQNTWMDLGSWDLVELAAVRPSSLSDA